MPSTTIQFPKINTRRLILWEMAPELVSRLFSTYSDEEAMAILQMDSEAHFTSLKDKFYNRSTHNERFSYYNFLLYETPDGPPVGDCCFHHIWRKHNRAEIGYTIWEDEYKGKGYMSEALEAVLKAGIKRLGYTRIEAFTADNNIPSMRLLQRFGFRREGVVPRHYVVTEGELAEPSLAWSLLPENFQNEWPENEWEALVQSFEAYTLPVNQWDHKAFLTVASWYLYHHGLDAALCKMRAALFAYHHEMGIANTSTAGYHETRTVFWMHLLSKNMDQKKPFETQLKEVLASLLAAEDTPYLYYSTELLDSVRARAQWVKPDLKSMD